MSVERPRLALCAAPVVARMIVAKEDMLRLVVDDDVVRDLRDGQDMVGRFVPVPDQGEAGQAAGRKGGSETSSGLELVLTID